MHKLRSNNEIVSSWRSSDILCSIACNSYNHEKFIENTLNGFLIQETTFPFEIIIHDDASLDGTQEIIIKYQTEYPDIIKPILQIENKKSKGIKPSINFVYPECKGKYIAKCEGDDYWTDPLKLQKQVDFLEAHPDYVMTYHDARVIDENGVTISDSSIPINDKKDFSKDEIITCNTYIQTLTLCFRNVVKEFPPEKNRVVNGDNFLTSQLGQYGKGKYMADIEKAAYRKHSGGVWSSKNETEKYIALITTYYWLHIYYNRIGKSKYAFAFYRKMAHMVKVLGLVNITIPSQYDKKNHKNNLAEKITKRVKYHVHLIRFWLST